MLLNTHFTPQSRSDLAEIGEYIARDNPRRAASFIEEMIAFIETIFAFPRRFPIATEAGINLRVAVYGHYHIYYQIVEESVTIVRVLHGARNIDRIFNQ